MGSPSQAILGENLTFTVQAFDGTGAPVVATGTVSYSVYEDETSTAILTGSMAQLAGQTGFYSEQIACTVANGFERFKTYTIRITATVSSVSVAKVYTFLCVGAEDTPTASTGALTTTANFKSYAGITDTDNDTLIGFLIDRATSAIEEFCDRVLRSDTYRERLGRDGKGVVIVRHYPITAIQLLASQTQDVIRITNTSSDAYTATVTVITDDADPSISETMTLTVSGGANAGDSSFTLADFTVTELVASINGTGSGWGATVNISTLGVWETIELLPVSGLACLDKLAYVQIPHEPEDDFMILGLTEPPYTGNNGKILVNNRYAFYRNNVQTTESRYGLNNRQSLIVKYTGGYTTTPADLEQICIDLANNYFQSRDKDLSIKSERLGDHNITFADMSSGIPKGIRVRLAPYRRNWGVA